jgi:hypothetical protein
MIKLRMGGESFDFKTHNIAFYGTIEKTSDLSTRRSQSLTVFQTPLGFSNVSAFSARSAVKLGV